MNWRLVWNAPDRSRALILEAQRRLDAGGEDARTVIQDELMTFLSDLESDGVDEDDQEDVKGLLDLLCGFCAPSRVLQPGKPLWFATTEREKD